MNKVSKKLKFGTNLLQHKFYMGFKLWDVNVNTKVC